MLFLANEPAKKAEINILTARDTTGPGFWVAKPSQNKLICLNILSVDVV